MTEKNRLEDGVPDGTSETDLQSLQRTHERLLVSMRQEAEALKDPLLLRLYDMVIFRIITGP